MEIDDELQILHRQGIGYLRFRPQAIVALQARLPSKRQRRNIFKSRAPKPKPNLKLLRDDAKKRKEFSKAIFEELDRHPLRDSDDGNAIEQLISDALNAAAMYVCPPAENEDPVWYTSDFKAKIEEMLAEKEPKKRKKSILEMRKLRQKLKSHFYKARAQRINQAAENLAEKFHLKYIAHVTRMSNSALQKQMIYCEAPRPQRRGQMNFWTKMKKATGIETEQLQKTMYNRNDFNKWMRDRYGFAPRPAKSGGPGPC